jgi:hypothetical protein
VLCLQLPPFVPSIRSVATVTVGRKRTNARHFVRDVRDVRELLRQMYMSDLENDIAGERA